MNDVILPPAPSQTCPPPPAFPRHRAAPEIVSETPVAARWLMATQTFQPVRPPRAS